MLHHFVLVMCSWQQWKRQWMSLVFLLQSTHKLKQTMCLSIFKLLHFCHATYSFSLMDWLYLNTLSAVYWCIHWPSKLGYCYRVSAWRFSESIFVETTTTTTANSNCQFNGARYCQVFYFLMIYVIAKPLGNREGKNEATEYHFMQ
jgi:hypothetical protein